MREIKFRGWHKDEKYMTCPLTLQRIKVEQGRDLSDYEWMQYTGLLDKQGKEIYELDKVSDGINPEFVVTWDFALLARLCEIASSLVIIGNIYENKELLNGE